MRHARADRLNDEPHRLAGHSRKPLHAKYIVRIRDRRDPLRKRSRIGNLGQRHHEAVEVVVVVLCLLVVARAAILDIILGANAEAEQCRGIDFTVRHGDDLDRAGQRAGNGRQCALQRDSIKEVALVQHHKVGARDLVCEYFLHRIVVFERWIGGTLLRKRFQVGGDPPVRQGRAVDHCHHPVDRDPAADCRPMEGLNQRLGQCQAGGFDHDMLHGGLPRQDRVESRHEFVSHGAAKAAVG